MKTLVLSTVVVAACAAFTNSTAIAIEPAARAAIGREFGEVQLRNLVLVAAAATASEPMQWNVYGTDPHHAGEVVKITVTNKNGSWFAAPGAAGKLHRVPQNKLDFSRVRISAASARAIAAQAATLAQATFVKVDYQLAANAQTATPEWGLGLKNASGVEIGFCVVSAESGALIFQDWTPQTASNKPDTRSRAEREAKEAARKVKQAARKAWNWTEDAGRKTGNFFKELFRRDD